VTPIAVNGEPARVNISLYPEGDGRISYEISTQAAIDEEQVVHSYGVILFSAKPGDTFINIQALRAECSFGTLTREQCYAAFKFMGIDYGPGHQGIEQLFIGQGQVLAKLSLPIDHTKDKYILHPGLMDSALQSSIGLMAPEGYGNLKPMLPFALEQIEILGNCTPSMWALVRYSHGSSFNDKVQKLDIDLCDSLGKINVRLKGFSSRVLGAIPVNKNLGTLMLQPTNIDVMEVPAKIKHLADIGLLMSTESNNDVLLKDEEFYQHLSEQIFKGEISKQQVEMILTSKMGGQNG